MMEFFDILKHLSETEEVFLIGLYSLILVANFLDVLFGWVNGLFNPEKKFKSGKALYGIVRKMMYFIVLVFFMTIAYIMVDAKIAFTATFTLTSAYLFSEIVSVLAHLGITEDDKSDLFIDFLSTIFKKNDKRIDE